MFLFSALWSEVWKKSVVRVGVGLVVVAGRRCGGIRWMRMVMVKLMLFVFAVLVSFFAA